MIMKNIKLASQPYAHPLMNKCLERIYADYLAGNRFEEYRQIIEQSKHLGFRHCTITELSDAIATNSVNPNDSIFLHRHDIDTDVGGARIFFEIEKSLGVRSTYYFRLSTVDAALIREINDYGSEVGYHYEELATYAKRHGLQTRSSILANMDVITADFEQNFRDLEKLIGFKIRSVASHGDFANRRLGLQNTEILRSTELRRRLGIKCESYDEPLMSFFEAYLADDLPTRSYKRGSPFDAIKSNKRICLLTHPRHWRTNALENTKDNLWRVVDDLGWRWRRFLDPYGNRGSPAHNSR